MRHHEQGRVTTLGGHRSRRFLRGRRRADRALGQECAHERVGLLPALLLHPMAAVVQHVQFQVRQIFVAALPRENSHRLINLAAINGKAGVKALVSS